MTLTVGSLFSGIGGLDLGFERAGMRTEWFVEIEPYCRRVLGRRWPGVQIFEDVREVSAYMLPSVDVLAGGFPCQDISTAGKGAGLEGAQSGLWSEFARLVGELRPRYVVVENVPLLRSRGFDRVLGDLAALGFDAEWDSLAASEFGAPHQRDRLWLVAYPDEAGRSQRDRLGAAPSQVTGAGIDPGWAAEPNVCRVDDGVPNRVDRLESLGNALVPKIAQFIGERLVSYERGRDGQG